MQEWGFRSKGARAFPVARMASNQQPNFLRYVSGCSISVVLNTLGVTKYEVTGGWSPRTLEFPNSENIIMSALVLAS
jgi:hypothetical protein